MKAFVLTLISSFLSLTTFASELKALKEKATYIRFTCINGGTVKIRKETLRAYSQGIYHRYAGDDFARDCDVDVDFNSQTIEEIHSWLTHQRITCSKDPVLLEKLRIAAEFFCDDDLSQCLDEVQFSTHYKSFEKEKESTYKGLVYKNADGKNLPHGKGEIFKGRYRIFEGVFVHGEKHGPGKEFIIMTNRVFLVYEGEFVHDLRCGKGKKFYEDMWGEKIKYEGDFKDGKSQGKGTTYHRNSAVFFVGDFAEGMAHGSGIIYDENNIRNYQGEMRADKIHGKGKSFDEEGKLEFEGQFIADQRQGKGVLYKDEKKIFIGYFVNNKKDGEGTFFNEDEQKIYHGQWRDDCYHGKGTSYYMSGEKHCEGLFESGQFISGKKYFEDGSAIEGDFINDVPSGMRVREYDEKEQLIYIGPYKEGARHGAGLLSQGKEQIPCMHDNGILQTKKDEKKKENEQTASDEKDLSHLKDSIRPNEEKPEKLPPSPSHLRVYAAGIFLGIAWISTCL